MPDYAPFRTAPRSGALRRAASLASALLLVPVLGACAATSDATPSRAPQPSLIGALPPSIDTFDFDGYRHFDDGSGGYSFRYRNERKKRLADVYIYPVATENAQMGHEALVLGSTRATMAAIQGAVQQGLYANFNVVGSATRTRGLRTVARVQATYLRDNLASYTMLYQSEYRGTLMKIRLSMPDNESNRANTDWDAFAERVFGLVVDDVESLSGPADGEPGHASTPRSAGAT